MSVQVEKQEKNMAKLTIEVSAEELELHWRKLIRKIRRKSTFRASVKEKHRER